MSPSKRYSVSHGTEVGILSSPAVKVVGRALFDVAVCLGCLGDR